MPGSLPRDSALLFLHIPKTGGTALVRLLDRLYPAEERIHLYEPPDGLPPGELGSLSPERLARLHLVVGHFHHGIHRLLPRRAEYITVVREPVDRVRSIYDHYRLNSGTGAWHRWIVEEDVDLDRFVEERPVNNGMVGWLLDAPPADGRSTRAMLDLAKQRLDAFRVVMLHEDLAGGVAELSGALGIPLPPLSRVNAATDRSSVSPSTARLIRERNALDVELYEHARATHDRHGLVTRWRRLLRPGGGRVSGRRRVS